MTERAIAPPKSALGSYSNPSTINQPTTNIHETFAEFHQRYLRVIINSYLINSCY